MTSPSRQFWITLNEDGVAGVCSMRPIRTEEQKHLTDIHVVEYKEFKWARYQLEQAESKIRELEELVSHKSFKVAEQKAFVAELQRRVAELEARQRLHDTIVKQLQRAQKAYTDIIEAENARLRSALEKIGGYFDTQDDEHECELGAELFRRMDIARAALKGP